MGCVYIFIYRYILYIIYFYSLALLCTYILFNGYSYEYSYNVQKMQINIVIIK